MNLIENINKIHFDIKNKFQDVSITENSNKEFGYFFNINTKSDNKELDIIIKKSDINNNIFEWLYYSNPINKDSLVTRISSIDNITEHMSDIFINDRFDSEYLEKINN